VLDRYWIAVEGAGQHLSHTAQCMAGASRTSPLLGSHNLPIKYQGRARSRSRPRDGIGHLGLVLRGSEGAESSVGPWKLSDPASRVYRAASTPGAS